MYNGKGYFFFSFKVCARARTCLFREVCVHVWGRMFVCVRVHARVLYERGEGVWMNEGECEGVCTCLYACICVSLQNCSFFAISVNLEEILQC
jgi:hypothetical protein